MFTSTASPAWPIVGRVVSRHNSSSVMRLACVPLPTYARRLRTTIATSASSVLNSRRRKVAAAPKVAQGASPSFASFVEETSSMRCMATADGGGNGGFAYSSPPGEQWAPGHPGYEWKSRLLTEKRDVALTYMCDVNKRTPIHDGVRTRAKLNASRLRSMDPAGEEGGTDLAGGAGASSALAVSLIGAMNTTLAESSLAGADDVISQGLQQRRRQQQQHASRDHGGLEGARDDDAFDFRYLWDMVEGGEDELQALSSLPKHDVEFLKSELLKEAAAGGRGADVAGVSMGRVLSGGSHKALDPNDALLKDWFKVRRSVSTNIGFGRGPEDRTAWSAWYLEDIK